MINYLRFTCLFFLVVTSFYLQSQVELWGVNSAGASGNGLLYSIPTGSTGTSFQYSFAPYPGASPQVVRLLQASNGKLYGTTLQGGANTSGILFEYDISTNSFIKKHDFATATGSQPRGSLIQAANGKIYGMTSAGGNGAGVIFEFDINTNQYTSTYSFTSASDGGGPYGGLIEPDPIGNPGVFYGLTRTGGSASGGTLFEYNRTTNTITVHQHLSSANSATASGGGSVSNLVKGANNKLYALTANGGANGANNFGTIIEFDYITKQFAKKFDLGGAVYGGASVSSFILALDGKLYAPTFNGAANNAGAIIQFSIDPGTGNGVCNKMFDFTTGTGGTGTGGVGSMVQLSNGNFFVLTRTGAANSAGSIVGFNSSLTSTIAVTSFTVANGQQPLSSLMLASNGLVYGVTASGGNSGTNGVLFEYNPTTFTYAKKIDFNFIQAGQPSGGLLLANNNKFYGLSQVGGTNSPTTSAGVLYEFDKSTNVLINKVNLNLTTGCTPYGALIQASNGNLYGVTSAGGTNSVGTLFEYNITSNVFTKKVDFSTSNGHTPYGSLVQAANGKLYGLTRLGGSNSMGTMFEFNTSNNTYSVLLNFSGAADGSNPFGSLHQASNGKLYGLTSTGGTSNLGVLFEFDPSTNTYAKLVDFDGVSKGSTPLGSVIEYSTGILYGLTSIGGSSNKGVMFEYNIGTTVFTVKHNFTGTTNGDTPWGTLVKAGNSKLYGVTRNGGSGSSGNLFEYDPNTSSYVNKLNFATGTGTQPLYTHLFEACIPASQPSSIFSPSSICQNAAASTNFSILAVGGATSYAWTFPAGTTTNSGGSSNNISVNLNALSAGSYTYGVAAVNGCGIGAMRVSTLIVHASPIITASNGTICVNQSFTLNPNGANSYTYQGGSNVVNPTTTTNYTIIGSNSEGCVSTPIIATVFVNPLPTVGSTTTNSVICMGFTTSLSGTGASSYVWTNGVTNGSAFSPTNTVTYTVTGTDANGCVNTAQRTITVNPLPTVGSTTTNSVICIGFTTSLSGTGASSYVWTNGVTNGAAFSPTNTVTYTVTGTDANGCVNTAQRTITVNPLPNVGSTTTNSVICMGFTTSLNGTGASSYVWTNGVTNGAAFSPTNTQTYTVTGTDANGCVNTAQRTITVNPLPTVGSTTTNSVICMGFTTSLSGTGASSYVWTNGVTNGAAFTPTITRTYTVTGTDANGCSNNAQRTVTVNALPIVGSTTTNSIICIGFTTSISGTGASSYVWTNGVTNGSAFSPTNTVTYTVTGTDANGCVNTAQRTITVNPLPTVGSTTTNSVICMGFTTSLSGTGASSYVWTNGVTNGAAFSPTNTVTYTVTGTDANGCVNTAQRTITVNPLPTVGSTTTNSVICMGFTTSLSGTGASSYVWTNGVTNGAAFTPTITRTYTVTGTDVNGCSNTAQRTVTVNALPTVGSTTTNSVICIGFTTSLSGTGASSYVWTNGVTNGSAFSPTNTVTYTVTGTDANGCINTAQRTITVNPLPNVGSTTTNSVICMGFTTSLSGTGASSYGWTNGVTNGAAFSPTITRTYTVTGTDANGCVNTTQRTITVNPLPTVGSTTTNSVICMGFTTSLSGTGASSYVWTNGVTNGAAFTPTITRTYTVTGTDANGCSNTAQRTVTVNALPTVGSTTTNSVICIGFTTSLNGTGASSYVWTNGVTNGAAFSPTNTVTYTVTGTDANGCVNTAQRTITVNPLPNVGSTTTNSVICMGFTTSLSGTGASSYVWTNGVTNGAAFSPTNTQTYTVTGTDANGCVNTAQRTITVNPLPNVGSSTTNSAICMGFTTSLSGTGANSFVWTNGVTNGTAFSPTTTITYTVTGTDNNGCTNTAQRTITVNPLPAVGATTTNSLVCMGGTTSVNGSGALSYTWTPGPVVNGVAFSPTITTLYQVIGRDINNCENFATTAVVVSPLPNVGSTTTSSLVCLGNTTSLNGTGANTYVWSNGVTNGVSFSPTLTTTYTVTGIDVNGCMNSFLQTIIVVPLPTVSVNSGTVCFGKVFTFTPSVNPPGTATYTFSSGSSTVSPTVNSVYTVIATNSLGCISANVASSTVTVRSLPTVNVNSGAICIGSTFTIIPTGAIGYTYSSGTNTVNPSTVGTHTFAVIGSSLGCVSPSPVVLTVTVNPLPILSINGSTAICDGQSSTLTVTGANTYTWATATGSTIVVTPTANANYSVVGTDQNGCVSNTLIGITVNPNPTITVNSGVVCPGGTFTFNLSGADTYTSTGGSTTVVTPTASSVYSITGTNNFGCISPTPAIANVTVVTSLTVTVSGNTTICNGETATLVANGAGTYLWESSTTNDTLLTSPIVTTNYSVVGSSGSCSDTAYVTVNVNNLPIVLASQSSSIICEGESTSLNVTGADTYTWLPSLSTGTNIVISPMVTTTYSVIGLDLNGCKNETTITQTVDACLSLNDVMNNQFITQIYPNPNNGQFVIELTKEMEVEIISSLGQVVMTLKLEKGKNEIEMKEEAKGIYFIQSSHKTSLKPVKLIKQ